METLSPTPKSQAFQTKALGRRLQRLRPWVQACFAVIWLAPLGKWLHGIPTCVFHCYSCPLSAFACPVGVAANYAALFPATLEVPFLLLGIVVSVAAATGALACGWACPFGFLQDLLGKVVPNKLTVPGWTGHGRFVVLIGLVLLTPMFFGWRGIPFEEQVVSICRLCPAGALEAGLPYSTQALMAGNGWTMSWLKTGILFSFLLGAIFIHRPWCRMLCPLGGFLALFNRVSLFHLRFKAQECVECNLCRSRCSMGVKVDQRVNVAGCIRCLECTTCGALEPALAVPGKLMDKPSAIKTDPRNVHNDH